VIEYESLEDYITEKLTNAELRKKYAQLDKFSNKDFKIELDDFGLAIK